MAEQELTKAQRLAEEVLRLSRNTLLVYLRFLDMALSRLELKSCDRSTLLTDGQYLLYHAPHVLKSFQYQKEIPVRDYLHVVMHCVYRHMFTDPSLDRPLWDLACDIAVEAVISELGLKAAEASRQKTQEAELQKLREESPADGNAAFLLLKKEYDVRTKAIKTAADKAGAKLSNVFRFCEEVFGDGQELLILVTELTISYYGAHFISRYGCKEYFEHNKELLFFERRKDIIRELETLDWEEE